ncbi:MAG TPA: flagellar hook capping FlgD N-terminal domain-containing protein [Geminicoccus sp.]|jgi:flagellar basal-body rod modification protein FlgD|uniref:flagellar hook assembly protein FlgD n=1 Tax=Geminicoccus sp. TaxID=2024832 RepID=UPI002E30B8EB|nr:flagellar hook capping FlgD N-terminal domain-containing protein [Geminicoccus sp.]HEX2525615.1 flagellar hook capping FlgD N-terminal domain-containing protein [Geminicoccus sp.]
MSSVASAIAAMPGGTHPTDKSAASTLTDNFDSFLSLLTTQLQNQDPLSPMDTETFTQQLVQFTSVEQSIKTNDSLEQLISLVQGARQTSSLGYLGTTVEAKSDRIALGASGPASISFELPSAAAGVSVRILDQNGQLVAETRGPTARGPHQISWDGLRTDGTRAPAGVYRVAIDARSADGKSLDVSQVIRGTVDSIDPSGSELVVSVGGVDVQVSDISSIAR